MQITISHSTLTDPQEIIRGKTSASNPRLERQNSRQAKTVAEQGLAVASSSRIPMLKWALAIAWTFAGLPAITSAQLPQIRLHSLFPAGGQVGANFDVTVTGGVDLEDLSELIFSNPSIVAVPKESGQDRRSAADSHTFTVTIPRDVQPGVYDVRVAGRYGLSNPRSFDVGWQCETLEIEPNETVEKATRVEVGSVVNARSNAATDVDFYQFFGSEGQRIVVECRAISLDSRMLPVVEAFDHRGRRLAEGRRGSSKDPILDLTLPSDGEYFVKVVDQVFRGGNEYFYRLHVHSNPHIDFVLPPSGLPGSTATYSLYGRNLPNGIAASIKSNGIPLDRLDVEISMPADNALLQLDTNVHSYQADRDRITYAVESNDRRSNRISIFFASAPIIPESEPNNTPASAQHLTLPAEFTGQFQSVGDIDYVQFPAKAQEVYSIEVSGHRDGTGVDPYLILQQVIVDQDAKETGTQQITAQDDIATDLFPVHFTTRNNDVRYRFTAPADANYRISLRDRFFESRGDPRLTYRLAIRREQPDFRLVVVPFAPLSGENNNTASAWPVGLRRGDNFAVRVIAFRRDGFDGPINLKVGGLPEGVSCQAASLGPGQSSTALAFSSTEDAPPAHVVLAVAGEAEIVSSSDSGSGLPKDRKVTRPARTGTIIWDGNQERTAHARLSRGLGLCVINELAPLQIIADANRIEVNRNRQILIPVTLTKRNGFDNAVAFQISGLPANTQAEMKPIPKGTNHQLQRIFVAPNAPLGTYSLLLRGQAQVAYSRRPEANQAAGKNEKEPKPQNLNVAAPALPIVLCIKEHPATLTATVPGDGSVKRGSSIDISVKVNRVNSFQGPVTLILPLPPNIQGLAATPISLAADQSDAVLKIDVGENATEGTLANLVVRATMSFNGDAAVDQPINLKVVQ